MNRRALIGSAPIAALAAALSAGNVDQAIAAVFDAHDTPIIAAYREIERINATVSEQNSSMDEDELDRMTSEMMALADKIVDMPIQGPLDFVFKVMGYTINGEHEIGDGPRASEIWAEARKLVS